MVIKLLFQYSLRPKSSNGCQTLKRCIEMLEHRTSGCNTAQQSHECVACLDINHQGKKIHEPILPYTMPEQQLGWYSTTHMALTLHDKTKWGMTLHHITQRDITLHYISQCMVPDHIIWYDITIFHCMMWTTSCDTVSHGKTLHWTLLCNIIYAHRKIQETAPLTHSIIRFQASLLLT